MDKSMQNLNVFPKYVQIFPFQSEFSASYEWVQNGRVETIGNLKHFFYTWTKLS